MTIFVKIKQTLMKIKILSAILLYILSAAIVTAQENKTEKIYQGFSGGMMVHTGFLSGGDSPLGYSPSGPTFGIGGAARVHLGKRLRVGFEGYFSNMGIDEAPLSSGSFNKLFWTGILADTHWKCGKFYPYIGATIGGGMETTFYMQGDKTDWIPEASSVYNKMPFFMVDPFVGVEYSVGAALRLTLKADWILAFNEGGLNRPMGPRLYFGFIFAH